MRGLLSGLLLATPLISIAHAQTNHAIVLYSGTAQQLSHIATDFRIEPTSGQAWIDLFVSQGFHTEDRYERQIRVDGLSYDAKTQQVVYTAADGRAVVCAKSNTRGKGWLQRNHVKPTGQCPITTQSINDGTEQRTSFMPLQQVNLVLTPILNGL